MISLLNDEDQNFFEHPLAIQLLKPKAEVYKRTDFDAKTRNICALSAPTAYILQCVHNPYFKSMPAFSKQDLVYHKDAIPPGQYNLMGWSPVDGFFQKLYEEARHASAGSSMMLFYADNLYLSVVREKGVVWLSLDGEKMECSHDFEDFEMYTDMIANEFDELDPQVRKVYKEIATISAVHAPV